jgi:iron(III) transport system substrate-binding protein
MNDEHPYPHPVPFTPTRRRFLGLAAAAAVGIPLLGCSDDGGGAGDAGGKGTLILYSGRDEALVQPLLDSFTEATGIKVEPRYGNSAEMGAQLLEEGGSTPAQVFYSQEVGAVGVLEHNDLLGTLPATVLDRVGARFRPATGAHWVGVTGRSRVIVVQPSLVDPAPTGIVDLVDDRYEGLIGWAPTNASFQSFVTAFRVSKGEDEARAWLEGIMANDPIAYENNTEVLDAVENGDLGIGLINHYYYARALAEQKDLTSQLVFPKGDDPGGLVNATAVAILRGAQDSPEALRFVEYLLSDEGQAHFVETTQEYPLVEGIEGPVGMPPLASLEGPQLDLTDLESLEETQVLLTDLGLIG